MLGRSHQNWKYGTIIGATVIVPAIYLIVNEWKGEPLPFACWVVIGFAVGWDLARMIGGKTRSRGKRRTMRRGVLRHVRTSQVGIADDWLGEGQEAAPSVFEVQTRESELRELTFDERMGYRYFDCYDGYNAPAHIDKG